jgi:hypothetical protein
LTPSDDLASCASVFPPETFHVFWPNDRVDVLPGPLALSDIADLTRVDLQLDRPKEPAQHAGGPAEPIGVELKLAAAMGPPRRVVATLIPNAHGSRLKRILFALPGLAARPPRRRDRARISCRLGKPRRDRSGAPPR